jgi:malonyl-CoA O-methyltransferase
VNRVDKDRVRRSFSRGAAEYDAHAVVQRRAVDRLLELALPATAPPRRVLDVGYGTGALLARLAGIFPGAALAGIDLAPGMALAARRRPIRAWLGLGDAEALPFRAGTFDLVVSTSTLQWLPRLERALCEARRVLAPGGTLAVAFFGGDTLHELRGAWRAAVGDAPDHSHHFHAERDLAAALAAAGLASRVLTSDRLVERHAHPIDLLHALKRIGAGNAAPRGRCAAGASSCRNGCGMGARGALERMASIYRTRHGGPDGVPATWDILYAVACRPCDAAPAGS